MYSLFDPETGHRILDLRAVPAAMRTLCVFQTLESITAGSSFQLITDSNPSSYSRQCSMELPGRFEWSELEGGPDVWRIWVRKLEKETVLI